MHVMLSMQARYPLIARVSSTGGDATNGTATQPGGPERFLLQANYTGCLHTTFDIHLAMAAPLVMDPLLSSPLPHVTTVQMGLFLTTTIDQDSCFQHLLTPCLQYRQAMSGTTRCIL